MKRIYRTGEKKYRIIFRNQYLIFISMKMPEFRSFERSITLVNHIVIKLLLTLIHRLIENKNEQFHEIHFGFVFYKETRIQLHPLQ